MFTVCCKANPFYNTNKPVCLTPVFQKFLQRMVWAYSGLLHFNYLTIRNLIRSIYTKFPYIHDHDILFIWNIDYY